MSKERQLREIKKGKNKKILHPFDVRIARNRFPKRKGNKARLYTKKIIVDLTKLHDSEMALTLLYESIKSYKRVLSRKQKQKRPISFITQISYWKKIDSFDVEYENFCMRVFNFRETLRNFVSEFLGIKAYGYSNFLDDSKIRELGIDKDFKRFGKNNVGKILNDRKNITHRIDKNFERQNKKLSDKLNQQKERLSSATKAIIEIMKIKDSICARISDNK